MIGLDTLTKYQINVNTAPDKLCLPILNIEAPLTCTNGNMYSKWPNKNVTLFTKKELVKLHCGFPHSPNDKLLNLPRLACPSEADFETYLIPGDIVKHRRDCQHYGPFPLRFKVAMPTEEDIDFGDEIPVNWKFSSGNAVLHVVDTATRFSVAALLDAHKCTYRLSIERVWTGLMKNWCTCLQAANRQTF